MGTVLIDNWTLESALLSLQTNGHIQDAGEMQRRDIQSCWHNFLISIVMWDRVGFIPYYDFFSELLEDHIARDDHCDNESQKAFEVKNIKIPTSLNNIVVPAIRDSSDYDNHGIRIINHDVVRASWAIGSNPRLVRRTYEYLLRSSTLGVNYFPHPQRAQYIYDHHIVQSVYSRKVLLDKAGMELNLYYTELSNALNKQLPSFEYPVLYDYIRKNANSFEEQMAVAIELRDSKEVKDFRGTLDNLDKKYYDGDLQAVLTAIKQIEESANELFSPSSELAKGQLTLSFPPALNIDFNWKRKRKPLSITFLTRLMDFGIHDRMSAKLYPGWH